MEFLKFQGICDKISVIFNFVLDINRLLAHNVLLRGRAARDDWEVMCSVYDAACLKTLSIKMCSRYPKRRKRAWFRENCCSPGRLNEGIEMRAKARSFGLILGVFLLVATPSVADTLVNGDFSDGPGGLDGWTPGMDGTASYDVVDSYEGNSNVLYLTATVTYTWDDNSGLWEIPSPLSFAFVLQSNFDSYAGLGALQFKASATCTGATWDQFDEDGGAFVRVAYAGGAEIRDKKVTDSTWSQSILLLPGLGSSNDTTVTVQAYPILSSDELREQRDYGDTRVVTIEAYFDDLEFIVPEPGTVVLLCCGGGIMLILRRPRRKVA